MQTHTLHSVSVILGGVSALLNGLDPMTTESENTHPVINTASNPVEKTEVATPAPAAAPAMHEANTNGSQFADVHAAIFWVSHEAQNPIKNRWSDEERFAWSDLPELYRMIKPLMYRAGLFHSQTMKTNAAGVPEIITTFRHIPTGTTHVEHLETTSTDLEKQLKHGGKNLDEHQRWGWTMTYCRRYALYAALGLQPDDSGDLDAISRRTRRRAAPQQSPATTSQREWLPMPGAEGEAAERAAVAMGAVPFTAEEYARAAEQERQHAPLTPKEIDLINRVVRPLNGDLRELDVIQRRLEAEFIEKVRTGSVTCYDEEDRQRAMYRVWLEACEEYDGFITAQIITGTDEEAEARIERHFGPDDEVVTPAAEDPVDQNDAAEAEQARLAAKVADVKARAARGEMMGDMPDAEELDRIWYTYKHGEALQPPFPEEPKLPAVNLTDEHATLMRAKVTLCKEIADGDGTTDDKVKLITQVLSRVDFQAAEEINEILARLTNSGAPASGLAIKEDDLPY